MNVAATSVPFQTIERGYYSAIEDALAEVYRTKPQFEAFWRRHSSNTYPPPDVPDSIDFSSQMVAVVFTGTKNSGGHGVEITSVDLDDADDQIVVNFMTSEPPPGAMATMALTQPYHVISLETSTKNVAFMGSAKPTPPHMPKFILSLTKDGKENRDDIVAKIEGLPSVKNVKLLGSLSIIFVDFDPEGSTSVDEARKLLRGIEGVQSVEEE